MKPQALNELLCGAVAIVFLGRFVQSLSCVQVSEANFFGSCYGCDATSFTFTLDGKVGLEDNTVNLAIAVDGSSSLSPEEFDLQKDFALGVVASLADKNLFANGGTASYVQYSDAVVSDGTFTSEQTFDDFVAADSLDAAGSAGDVRLGVAKARELLGSSSPPAAETEAAAAFMLVVVSAGASGANNDDLESAADAARAEGIKVVAVGIGDETSESTLLALAGDPASTFLVGDFDALDGARDDILGSMIDAVTCRPQHASLHIRFNAVVASLSAPRTKALGNSAVISLDGWNPEAGPAPFEVILDTCDSLVGHPVVSSVRYRDLEGSSFPDQSKIEGTGIIPDCGTFAPTPVPGSTPDPSPCCFDDNEHGYSTERRRQRRPWPRPWKPPYKGSGDIPHCDCEDDSYTS